MPKQSFIFLLLFFIILVFANYLPHYRVSNYDLIKDSVNEGRSLILSIVTDSFSWGFEPEATNSIITITAVGDIMMGTTFPTPLLPANDGKVLFQAVKAELSNSDIAIGNLEAPLCDSGKSKKEISDQRSYSFCTPTKYVKNLVDAGFDVINLANNHSFDFGWQGVKSTRNILDSAGIKYTGIIGDIAELTIKSRKILVIGFSPHYGTYSLLNIPKAQRNIARLKQKADIVIVTFHGGKEGINALHTKDTFEYHYDEPRGNVVQFSHAVIDSGADLVLGHGPHVPRALEVYKNKLIAYSLGNFCTYGRFSVQNENGLSLILKVNLDTLGNFVDGKIIPLLQKPPGILITDSTGRSIKLIRELSRFDFPLTAPDIDDSGFIIPKIQEITSTY